jgi:hypothetical protein
VIGTIWIVWAVLTVLAFAGAMFIERSAVKVDDPGGWVTFGWFMLFILWGIPVVAGVSLVAWLVQHYL